MTAAEMAGRATADATLLAALIHEQSAAEQAGVTAEGERRAEQIRATTAADAQAISAAAEREGAALGRRRAATLEAVAEAQGRMLWLQAREALIDAVMERTRAQLANLASLPHADRILAALLQEALKVLPDLPLRVRMPLAYQPLLDAALPQTSGAPRIQPQFEEHSPSGGGVIAATADGRLVFDNSFSARLQRSRESLRQTIARVLFSPESPAVPAPTNGA
jgi:vacuolar-type H+-ATPase subunit E/Vma4